MNNSSMVMTRIGGVDYPLRSDPNCKTCQSPHRIRIEADLIRGHSYRAIARSLEGLPEGVKGHPTRESISNHVQKGHLPIGQAVQRRIIERRAREIGQAVEDSEEPLVDHITINRMIVQKGFEAMASGSLDIKASDVVQASRFLHQVEKEAGGDIDAQAWIQAVMEYMEIAQRFIPSDQWAAYGAALQRSPVLRSLAQRQSQTIEGEVADEEREAG